MKKRGSDSDIPHWLGKNRFPSREELAWYAQHGMIDELKRRLDDMTLENLVDDAMDRRAVDLSMVQSGKIGRKEDEWELLPPEMFRMIALYADIRQLMDNAQKTPIFTKFLLSDTFWRDKFYIDFPEVVEFLGRELPVVNVLNPTTPMGNRMFNPEDVADEFNGPVTWKKYYLVVRYFVVKCKEDFIRKLRLQLLDGKLVGMRYNKTNDMVYVNDIVDEELFENTVGLTPPKYDIQPGNVLPFKSIVSIRNVTNFLKYEIDHSHNEANGLHGVACYRNQDIFFKAPNAFFLSVLVNGINQIMYTDGFLNVEGYHNISFTVNGRNYINTAFTFGFLIVRGYAKKENGITVIGAPIRMCSNCQVRQATLICSACRTRVFCGSAECGGKCNC